MKRIKVKSSNIESVGYEIMSADSQLTGGEETGTLEVEFKGGNIYSYLEVPEIQYHQLMKAESVGKYFSANIKKAGYKFEKVEKRGEEKESLLYLVKELFKMLDTVEESDSGTVFRPTSIETCRVLHATKLKEILPKIRKIIE